MIRIFALHPSKGIHLEGVTVDVNKLGKGIMPEGMDANTLNDETCRHITWLSCEPQGPIYTLMNVKEDNSHLRGDMFIELHKKTLLDLDPNTALYRQIADVEDTSLLFKRAEYEFNRAIYTHLNDWYHIHNNLLPAVVLKPNEDLSTKYSELLLCMHDLLDMDPDEKLHQCAFCSTVSPGKFKQCACRRGVRYCSIDCQRKHWTAGHKEEYHSR